MGNTLAESWLYATVLVENQNGAKGTGFLVRRTIDEEKARIFLVTNKHVIAESQEARARVEKFNLHLNVKDPNGKLRGETVSVIVHGTTRPDLWLQLHREHPDPDVDVLAFDVTALIIAKVGIANKWSDYSLFASREKLDELDVTIGDDVMVIGYPLGLRHRETNFPLFRSGVISTKIGETLEDEVRDPKGVMRKRTLRGFLVDGAMIPGSSGSPVVLKPIFGRKVKNTIMGSLPVPVLLGIMAETRYAPVQAGYGDSWSYAGLGLAFDAETVKETIELFFK